MKILILLTSMLSFTIFSQTEVNINNHPYQAKTSYYKLKSPVVESTYISESQIGQIAEDMVDGDYLEKKIYTKNVKTLTKKVSHFSCSKNMILISGENKDIAKYATVNKFEKVKQVISGFLGTSYSLGAALYNEYTCTVSF